MNIFEVYYNSYGQSMYKAHFTTIEKVEAHMKRCLPDHTIKYNSYGKAGWRVNEWEVDR